MSLIADTLKQATRENDPVTENKPEREALGKRDVFQKPASGRILKMALWIGIPLLLAGYLVSTGVLGGQTKLSELPVIKALGFGGDEKQEEMVKASKVEEAKPPGGARVNEGMEKRREESAGVRMLETEGEATDDGMSEKRMTSDEEGELIPLDEILGLEP